MLVEDDGLKPGQGKQIADKFLKTEKVKLITGIVFSNIVGATVPDILDAGAIYVSPNAAPSNFSGKDCNKNYFVVSWQNDSLHESAGQNATNLGYKKAFILGPNYQAGKDALAGFKRYFKGEIVGELYTRLDQTDYARKCRRSAPPSPTSYSSFTPAVSAFPSCKPISAGGSARHHSDGRGCACHGHAHSQGDRRCRHWRQCQFAVELDFDNDGQQAIYGRVAKESGADRLPTFYASQGYDTALAIGAALKGVKGDLSDTDSVSTAMLKADFHSVRGAFKFGNNQHPIQDWYAMRVEKGPGWQADNQDDRKSPVRSR